MNIKRILLTGFLFLLTACTPTIKQFELAENRIVHLKKDYGSVLYEKRIHTKGYTILRLFAHIYNEEYDKKPLAKNSTFKIIAYYGIGQGSWGYFSKEFPFRSTSGWAGVADIPIVGEETRITVYSSNIKERTLKVDVTATLF